MRIPRGIQLLDVVAYDVRHARLGVVPRQRAGRGVTLVEETGEPAVQQALRPSLRKPVVQEPLELLDRDEPVDEGSEPDVMGILGRPGEVQALPEQHGDQGWACLLEGR